MTPTRFALGLVLATVAGLVGSAGCGGGPPPPTDPAAGVSLLRTALEAWQAGEAPDALKGRAPPLTVVDKDWSAGAKLTRFEIEESAAKPNGYDLGCPVRLWLGDGKKPPVRVRYVVALSPNQVITRDFGG